MDHNNGNQTAAAPATETAPTTPAEPTVELTEEQELARLQQLQHTRKLARVHAAQQAIAGACRQFGVQLVAQPQLTPDGRIVAPIAILPVD